MSPHLPGAVVCDDRHPRAIVWHWDKPSDAREPFRHRRDRAANAPTVCYVARGGRAMKVLAATLALLVSSPAAAQECQTCSSADACIQTYLKATSQAQRETKQAIRDWKENLDRKASGELFSKGSVALQGAMESQVRLELERLKECLAKIK
jgi:hypothetical protein